MKKNPSLLRSWPDMGPLKLAIHHDLFPLSCVQRCLWAQSLCETIHSWPGGLFILLDYISHQKGSEGTSLGKGLQGAAVDKQSLNSWWSGPLRGQWSSLLKPLVRRRLFSHSPCWLHKAKVLYDCLQARLFCFVLFCLSCSLTHSCSFYFLSMDLQKILLKPEGDMILSWLLSCTVHWGLADVQLCLLFPGHILISGTLKFLSLERACTSQSLIAVVGRWITPKAFVWQTEPVAIVHMLKKPYGWNQFDLVLII